MKYFSGKVTKISTTGVQGELGVEVVVCVKGADYLDVKALYDVKSHVGLIPVDRVKVMTVVDSVSAIIIEQAKTDVHEREKIEKKLVYKLAKGLLKSGIVTVVAKQVGHKIEYRASISVVENVS